MSQYIPHTSEVVLLDRPREDAAGQRQKILRKITTRLTKNINVDEWNYYHRIGEAGDKIAATQCRAIRFTGRNLSAITQPTGLHSTPDHSASIEGSIHFKRTSHCPAQKLGVGEYLSWDGKCFTVRAEQHFHSVYRHQ